MLRLADDHDSSPIEPQNAQAGMAPKQPKEK
jgi:hypothetical protein